MNKQPTRRSFLRSSASAVAVAAMAPARIARAGRFTGKIKKAVKYHMIQVDMSVEDKLKMLKDLGFDGVEPRSSLHPGKDVDPKVLARASEKTGLPVHGVVNSSNTELRRAIDQAKMYGANSVLTTIPRMPRDGSYMENYRQTQKLLLDAAPYAEKQQVFILIENVWSGFLIEPLSMARYVDEIDSPFVKVYFDIGNVVRWGWPHYWIEVLGKRIVKLDIKEFDLNVAMSEGMRKAFDKPIGQGSIEWNKVRDELAKLNFEGWATAEVAGGNREHLAKVADQMNHVLDL